MKRLLSFSHYCSYIELIAVTSTSYRRSPLPASSPASLSASAASPACGSVHLEYTVMTYRQLTSADEEQLKREAAWSPAPRGVFCPRPDIYRRQLPAVPDTFSVKIETVNEVSIGVFFYLGVC